MVSGLFLALGALSLIVALSIIGLYPNPNWHLQAAWVGATFYGIFGLVLVTLGFWMAFDEAGIDRFD